MKERALSRVKAHAASVGRPASTSAAAVSEGVQTSIRLRGCEPG